ncbi:GNAT family N-acetyltransferase [Solimonas sp. K1W22B-7]|uniref:GNAT family N-acetyltransferase n=1 Tax=Solimonas sp. K1W22B-7 TaxID=2303331 RepID=UPI000E3371A3|nr:GNAT family N-acetyltransferase [Solimonas sp. K1W22B-7]AXQ27838.1 GNAT family N-acetyltransferase [Solimonas sp. K1W22B-7]
MDARRYAELEAAAFAAWPALEAEDYLGWRLQFTEGYTKRANSANCGLDCADLSTEQVAEIEQRYRQRGLPTIFRLSSVAAPPGIDDLLAARGYRWVDESLVMTLPLQDLKAAVEPLVTQEAGDWLATFQHASGGTAPGQETHLRMLRSIRAPCAFAVEQLGGEPVCWGLGVLVDGKLGLFDIATAAAHRQRGRASRLCAGLMAWGRDRGADLAYLQVTGSNAAAIRVYEKLGFRRAYRYWYRVGA